MATLEAEVFLQHLTAGWRTGRCYPQPLQDISATLAWAVQMEVQSITFSASSGVLGRSGTESQCLFVVLLHACLFG